MASLSSKQDWNMEEGERMSEDKNTRYGEESNVVVNHYCHLEWFGRSLGLWDFWCVYEGVSKDNSVWNGKLRGETCPECGQQCPRCWGPEGAKRRRRKLQWSQQDSSWVGKSSTMAITHALDSSFFTLPAWTLWLFSRNFMDSNSQDWGWIIGASYFKTPASCTEQLLVPPILQHEVKYSNLEHIKD